MVLAELKLLTEDDYRESRLEDLSLATFRLLGFDYTHEFPSRLPSLGTMTLQGRLHPHAFDALVRAVIQARVSDLDVAREGGECGI